MTQKIYLLSLIFFLCCVRVDAQQELFPFLGQITTNDVNIRSGQSENFERLLQLKQGDEVVVVDKKFSWYKVRLPKEAKAFIIDKYVQMTGDKTGEVITDRVNIRSGAGVNFTVITQVNKGQQVFVLKKVNEWYQIMPVNESFGWVLKEFVKFKSSRVPAEQEEQEAFLALAKEDTFQAKSEPIQPKQEESPTLNVKGILKPPLRVNETDTYYRLVMDDKTAYYVQGIDYLLDRYLNYTVSIQGQVVSPPDQMFSYPLLKVSKIETVL